MRMRPAIILAAALAASSAGAQSPSDDWEVVRDAQQDTVMAGVVFDHGVGIATRCSGRAFEVFLIGLEPSDEQIRTLRVDWDAPPPEDRASTWVVGRDPRVAYADLAPTFARSLREGGSLHVTAPGLAGAPSRRYVLDLPPSSSSINETLAACGKPLDDARVSAGAAAPLDIAPAELDWDVRPMPHFPQSALRSGVESGRVGVSCVAQASGRLSDCVVESEYPAGNGFGVAAVASLRAARLKPTPGAASRLIGASIAFRAR